MMLALPSLLHPGHVAGLMLAVARVTAFMVTAPVLSARVIPTRVKAMMGLVLGATAWMAGGSVAVADVGIVDAVINVVIGLLMGLAARAALEAAFAAGSLFSILAGLSFASTVDPLNGGQSDVAADLLSMLALMSAVALGLHREAIAVICASLQTIPPGASLDMRGLFERLLPLLIGSMALAVRLAFPMMAATTVGYVIMGLMARGSPALGLQGLGFTVPVLAGGFALHTMAPAVAEFAARAAVSALQTWR
jgi:flagellar biosynthetic protein FliR